MRRLAAALLLAPLVASAQLRPSQPEGACGPESRATRSATAPLCARGQAV